MKTITDLNAKWWYRLVKVAYLLFALLIVIVVVSVVVDAYDRTFNDNESYVSCNDGRKFFVDKMGMYGDYVSSYDDKSFRTWCATTMVTEDGTKKLKLINGPVPEEKNYTFVAVYTPRDWTGTIGSSALWIAVILLVSEGIRRIFYYIILGSLRPLKK